MRAIWLGFMFFVGMLAGIAIWWFIFIRALLKGTRAFHGRGTTCLGTIRALDDVVGPRLAGAARVRLSAAAAEEDSTEAAIFGMAIECGGDRTQNLAFGTFESFLHLSQGTASTDVTDYLSTKHQFGSVAPWRAHGVGTVWLRAISQAAPAPSTATKRTERLRAHVAAKDAKFVIELRKGPEKDGELIGPIAELELTEVLPADAANFRVSMFHTGRGVVPTGFRNGIRAIVYPVSQTARRLRGG